MQDFILYEQHPNGVGVLTFNRPHSLNALNSAAMRQFADLLGGLKWRDDLRVLILTGAGDKAFCSGGDLVELREKPSAAEGLEMVTLMGDALLQLEQLPIPVIAAINGYALGGGSEIALACDMRVVDENTRMGFVQISMALTPGWGAGQRLARLVGVPKAMELLLSGQPLNADILLAWGLANRKVEAGQALAFALNWSNDIAARPREVVRGIKALLQAHKTQPYEKALLTERSLFPSLWEAPAHVEAVEAFFARKDNRHAEG
jgi:enoyl-CoA hydratase